MKAGTPRLWRRMCPELRKHKPEAMLKEKERKTRRGVMDSDDMGVGEQDVVQCSAVKPLVVVWIAHGQPELDADPRTPPGTTTRENHENETVSQARGHHEAFIMHQLTAARHHPSSVRSLFHTTRTTTSYPKHTAMWTVQVSPVDLHPIDPLPGAGWGR